MQHTHRTLSAYICAAGERESTAGGGGKRRTQHLQANERGEELPDANQPVGHNARYWMHHNLNILQNHKKCVSGRG